MVQLAPVPSLTLPCPAKINLFLAVTGRRADGFHDLVSVVIPLAWGDELSVQTTADGAFTLACDNSDVPADDTNLVLRAAKAFRGATGWTGGAHFELTKRIPAGAGLGGGSSDAVAALRALNQLAGQPLTAAGLSEVAVQVGSDCPLFLADAPVTMRGRGERIEPLPAAVAARLRGQRVLLCKPPFGINTAWAYRQLAAAAPVSYQAPNIAEAHVAAWMADPERPLEDLAVNSFEAVVFAKQVTLPVLAQDLRETCGLHLHLSGSGSACFVLLDPDHSPVGACERISRAWGPQAWMKETQLSH